jgi:hypothetical protein
MSATSGRSPFRVRSAEDGVLLNRGALKMSVEICWRRATGRALAVFSRPQRDVECPSPQL